MPEQFYNDETGFRMDIHFESLFQSIPAVMEEYKPKIATAINLIQRMENGEIVNHTAVAKETEDRQVDYYNLRLAEEKVPGKSLTKTIEIWNETKPFVADILAKKIKPAKADTYKTVIYNGIGGSYLGPLMLIFAKYGMD